MQRAILEDTNVNIASTAVIGKNVEIGSGTSIGDFVVIHDNTIIGKNNRISSHVVIGGDPQDRSFRGETSRVVIGDNNIIREFVTLHRAIGENAETTLGNDCYLMVGSHLGHNAQVGNGVTLANNVALGGYVQVHDYVTFGGGAVVHQNCRIGAYAMLSGNSGINHDIVPFMTYIGTPSQAISTNRHALVKHGFSQEVKSEIMRAFKLIYFHKQTPRVILERLKTELKDLPEINYLIKFIEESKRGIVLGRFTRNYE